MNMDPTIDYICDLLRTKHGCHSAILYGSHARGDATSTSDYDVAGIRESGETFRDARLWNGSYLDVFVYPQEKILSPDESMIHMRQGKVLFQKADLATRFLLKLNEIFSAGPKRLTPDEVNARAVWARKMIDRARAGDVEGNFRRAWLLTALLEDYFLIRGQWYPGPRESLRHFQQIRPDLYSTFDAALKPGAALYLIEALVELVFATSASSTKP